MPDCPRDALDAREGASPTARRVEVQIVGDSRNLERAFGRVGQQSGKLESGLRRLGKASIYVGTALAAGAVYGLEKSVHAAVDAQASQARLEQAFKASGLAMKPYVGAIGRAESASRKLGFTDTEVKDALGSLTVATHDYTKSAKDLSVAQDLARFKHVGLTDATKMLTMAMTGSQRAAKQLGIVVIPTTKNVDALKRSHVNLTTELGKSKLAEAKLQDKMALGASVIDQVTKKTKGQAKAFSKTAAGGLARFNAEFDNLKVVLGTPLLNSLGAVADGLSTVVGFVGKIAHAKNLTVGISIATSGIKDIRKRLSDALFGSTSAGSDFGAQFPKTFHDGLIQKLTKMDWKPIGAAISSGLVLSANAMNTMLSQMLAWVSSHAAAIAKVGALIAANLVITLTDPSFWAHHMDLLAGVILIAFGSGIGKVAGRFGGVILARLGPVFSRAFGELSLFAMRGVARLPALLGDAIAAAGTVALRAMRGIWHQILGETTRGVGAAGAEAGRLGAFFARAFRLGAAVTVFRLAMSTMVGAARSGAHAIASGISSGLSAAGHAAHTFASTVTGAMHAVLSPIHAVVNAIQTLWGWLQRVKDFTINIHIPVPHVPHISLPHIGIPGRAAGGFVPGGMGQAVPIIAHAGEIVLNPKQQAALGGPRYLSQLFGFHGENGPGSSMASGGKVGKGKKHHAPKLPESIRLAEARAAGTPDLGDDISAKGRELAWVNQELGRHDLTAGERGSLKVRRVRVQTSLRKLRSRRANESQRDYSQLPAGLQLAISNARLAVAEAVSNQQIVQANARLRAALWDAKHWLERQLRRRLSPAQRAAVVDAIASITDEIKGITDPGDDGGSGDNADLQAQLEQANARAAASAERARLDEAFIATGVFGGGGGGGPLGSQGGGGGGNGHTFVFNSLFPYTEEQARQAAAAAAQGAGRQPYRSSSVVKTGY